MLLVRWDGLMMLLREKMDGCCGCLLGLRLERFRTMTLRDDCMFGVETVGQKKSRSWMVLGFISSFSRTSWSRSNPLELPTGVTFPLVVTIAVCGHRRVDVVQWRREAARTFQITNTGRNRLNHKHAGTQLRSPSCTEQEWPAIHGPISNVTLDDEMDEIQSVQMVKSKMMSNRNRQNRGPSAGSARWWPEQ